MQRLARKNLDRFIGRDIRELRTLCEDLHTLYPANPGAKAALDIAFHDLFAQYLEIPLVSFLGQKISSLPTSITIGIKNVEETLEEAAEYVERGFKILKVKLGHSLDEDLDRLRSLRSVYGNKVGIRVDANQGYSVEDLTRFHAETQNMNLELVEQPLKADAIDTMKSLPEPIRRTIAADESLITARDAYQLAADPVASGVFNIKLMKCGGIYQAMRIAEVARLASIDLMWGCNDESIVSISAAMHVAFACSHTRYIDLDGSLDLAKDLVEGGFELKEGVMYPNGKPGLGVKKL